MHSIITCAGINNIGWTAGADCDFDLDSISIWKITIPDCVFAVNDFEELLNADEQKRAERYHNQNDRERFIISRGALRILLSMYLNTDAKAIVFEMAANKKSFVKNTEGIGIHYNTTHSGDYILIAVANAPVGIDVEKLEPMFPYSDILEHTFSQQEIDVIDESVSPLTTFYTLWTRKEALLKATGKGIDDDMKLIPCMDGEHTVESALTGANNNWQVNSFVVSEACCGSVAAETDDIKFINFELK